MSPGNPIPLPTATRAQTWRGVGGLASARRGLTAAALTTLVLATAAGLLVPPILGHLVDLVTGHRPPTVFVGPAVALAGLAVAQAAFTGLGNQLVARLGETMLATLRERVLRRALAIPLGRMERAGTGDLVSRVSGDVAVVGEAVRSAVPELAGAGLTVVLTLVGLAALDWRFALAGLLAAPIQLHTLRWYLRRSTPIFAADRVADGARTQQLLDAIGAGPTVRALNLSSRAVAAVRDRSLAALRLGLSTNRLATRFYGRLNLAEFVGLAAILTTGFLLVRADTVTVGTATAAALYFHRLFDPINTLLGLIAEAQAAAAGLARLIGIDQLPTPTPATPAVPHQQPRADDEPAVHLDQVTFGYRPEHPVLREVTLRIPAGQRVALVGASGAGKTTLAMLVAGILQPDRGHIDVRTGPHPPHPRPAGGLPAGLVLVSQDSHVFAGSIADDLRLAAPAASDSQLRDALHRVAALDWIDRLPDGLATPVGDGGTTVTPTQAQQLALARVILADPTIVILDEATADAGSAGARLLDHAAAAALAGRTALVITHRLGQAATTDRIIVLDGGRITEDGSHHQLIAAGGAYAALWAASRPIGDRS